MSDVHATPGWFERRLLAIPDGAMLRAVFLGVVGLAGTILATDLQRAAQGEGDRSRMRRTEPMPLSRPVPGDQVRPYLPRAVPVAPDRGKPIVPGVESPLPDDALARPMRFVRADDRSVSAVGRIDPGSADDLGRFLDGEGKGAGLLVLHSPGGSVRDALAMARLVRERGIETAVPADGYCASACPLLFSGGVARSAGEDAWIGVHQVYAVDAGTGGPLRDLGRSIADIQATTAECQQLLVDMGVDPQVWIKAMQTPADELYVLTRDELETFRLVAVAPASKPG